MYKAAAHCALGRVQSRTGRLGAVGALAQEVHHTRALAEAGGDVERVNSVRWCGLCCARGEEARHHSPVLCGQVRRLHVIRRSAPAFRTLNELQAFLCTNTARETTGDKRSAYRIEGLVTDVELLELLYILR